MAENGGLHMPNRTLVPDKLQGYLLQVRHMLYELISVDDRIVSIEKLDDVAVEADGKVIAEQVWHSFFNHRISLLFNSHISVSINASHLFFSLW